MRKSMLVLAAGALLLSCGSTTDAPSGNTTQPGCTQQPDCEGCASCFSKCLCTTSSSNQDACAAVCGISGAGGQAGAGGASGAGGAPPGGTGGAPTERPQASGLRITEVAVYQGVKIPIMQNGADVAQRNASVVADRPALVRVFVTPEPGYQPRDVVCRLDLSNGQAQEIPKLVQAASSEADFQSAFNFDVPADQFKTNLDYIVTLLETTPTVVPGDTSGARWPAQGGARFAAQSANGTLKVVLVPLVVNGVTPDTSPARVKLYHDRVWGMYPVPELELSVRAPISFPNNVSGLGSGWGQALQYVLNARQQDNVPRNVFYYGVLTPTTSLLNYCDPNQGCVFGVGPQASAQDDFARGAIGIGFFPTGASIESEDTMAHEFGHAFGRAHTRCGAPGENALDPNYPHAGGSIGSWGYDLVTKALKEPARFKDILSYCNPNWISDYNYEGLFRRVSYVNLNPYFQPPAGRSAGAYRVALLELDGRVTWSGHVELREPPLGEERRVPLLDVNSRPLGTLVGYEYPLSGGGAMLLVKDEQLRFAAPTGQRLRPFAASRTLLTIPQMTNLTRQRMLFVLSGLLSVGCNTQKEAQPTPEPAASQRAPIPVERAEPAEPQRPAASAAIEAREVPRAAGAAPSGSAAGGKEHRCTPGGCAPGKCA